MKIVTGIGNPGKRYLGTRHNVGFEVVDLVAGQCGTEVRKRRFLSKVGSAQMGTEQVFLVKPQTYVNETGQAVRQVIDWMRLTPQDVLVVCDDANLELGCGRVRAAGSSGGHKGLQSVIDCLGTEEFPRLRIGVGSGADTSLVDHVLSRFSAGERKVLQSVIDAAAAATRVWVTEDIEACMNGFNGIGQRQDGSTGGI